jgi:hypothetical protein
MLADDGCDICCAVLSLGFTWPVVSMLADDMRDVCDIHFVLILGFTWEGSSSCRR